MNEGVAEAAAEAAGSGVEPATDDWEVGDARGVVAGVLGVVVVAAAAWNPLTTGAGVVAGDVVAWT